MVAGLPEVLLIGKVHLHKESIGIFATELGAVSLVERDGVPFPVGEVFGTFGVEIGDAKAFERLSLIGFIKAGTLSGLLLFEPTLRKAELLADSLHFFARIGESGEQGIWVVLNLLDACCVEKRLTLVIWEKRRFICEQVDKACLLDCVLGEAFLGVSTGSVIECLGILSLSFLENAGFFKELGEDVLGDWIPLREILVAVVWSKGTFWSFHVADWIERKGKGMVLLLCVDRPALDDKWLDTRAYGKPFSFHIAF